MVEHLLKLQLTLTRNAFRRSTWLIVGTIFGLLFALLYGGGAAVALASMRFAGTVDLARLLLPTLFSLFTLGYVLMVLLMFGTDATLDPARFALFPVRARALVPGFMLIGLVCSVGGLFTTALLIGFVIAFSWTWATTLVAVVGGVLGMVSTFLLSRWLTSAFASGLAGRKTRDMATLLFTAVALLFGVGAQFLGVVDFRNLEAVLAQASTILGWTPFGWGWSAPADVAAGQPLLALVKLVLAAAWTSLCLWGWIHYLDKALTSPIETGGGGSGKVGAHGVADRLYPSSPWGAIAARSLRYWRRDPRHLTIVAMTVILPVIWLAPAMLHQETFEVKALLFGPPMATIMFGSAAAQELAYDGSALWTHIVAGVRGWEDRLGRLVAALTVLGPMVLLVALLAIGFNWRSPELGVACLGATVALAGAGIGAGSFTGAIWNVPVPPPGSSPFARSSGGGMAGLISFFVGMGITLLASTPTIVLAFLTLLHGWPAALGALVLGLATAAGMLWFGVRVGGRQLEKRWPEMLAMVTFEG